MVQSLKAWALEYDQLTVNSALLLSSCGALDELPHLTSSFLLYKRKTILPTSIVLLLKIKRYRNKALRKESGL